MILTETLPEEPLSKFMHGANILSTMWKYMVIIYTEIVITMVSG